MTKANFTFETYDLESWNIAGFGPRGFNSNYGVQMAYYDGVIYGIITQEDNTLMSTSWENGSWSTPQQLPSKYKALGRVSVAVGDGRFYVAYRGTNNGVYLILTTDFENWIDLGRVGSQYAKTFVAPAIGALGEGAVMVTGVGEDKYIYWKILDTNGKRVMSWTKIPGTGTQSALALALYEGDITLVHTAYDNGAFFHQHYDIRKKEWSSLKKVEAANIASGVAAVYSADGLCVAYKGYKGYPTFKWEDSDGKWSDAQQIYDHEMLYQVGMCVGGNMEFKLSAPFALPDAAKATRYRIPAKMNDKERYISEKDEEWNCQWQEKGKEQKTSVFGKFFCC